MSSPPGSHARLTAPRIEAAAMRLIARDGNASVSMRQVAADAGVQVGAQSNHIADKRTLLLRLIDTAQDAADAAWAAVPPTGDPSERLDAAVAAHLRFVLTRPEVATLPQRELAALPAADRARVQGRIDARRAVLERILQDGREQELFHLPDAGLLVTAILSAIEGVACWAPGSGLAQDRVERMSLNIVRRMVPRIGR